MDAQEHCGHGLLKGVVDGIHQRALLKDAHGLEKPHTNAYLYISHGLTPSSSSCILLPVTHKVENILGLDGLLGFT